MREVPQTIGRDEFLRLEENRSAAGNYFVENRALNLRFADFAALWPRGDQDPTTAFSVVLMPISLLLLGMMYGGIPSRALEVPVRIFRGENIMAGVSN
jgi:hypothetical protein